MGFNTAVLVLNDALNEIKSDPAFGANLTRAIIMGKRDPGVSARSKNVIYASAAEVISTGHSSQYQVCVFGGNTGWAITADPNDGVPEDAIKQIEAILKLRRKAKKSGE